MTVARREQPEETIMSTAEKLKREGEARGEARGRAEVVTKQLTKRFGVLPKDIVDRIKVADTTTLDRWAERLLDAKTLEQVFAAE